MKPLVLQIQLVFGSPQERKSLVPALHIYLFLGTTVIGNIMNAQAENINLERLRNHGTGTKL
jgi:hypothetical protein